MITQNRFKLFVWTIFFLAISFPLIVWGDYIGWDISSISLYQWFPLFGILAWTIMWTHYVTGAVRIMCPDLKNPEYYGGLSWYIVLCCLLLHPGILAYAQYSNGSGLPPASYYAYVSSGLKIAVMFGIIALIIFLSFEVFNSLKSKSYIKKWWLYISISQSFAMTLIFIHALRLGNFFGSDWLLFFWYIFGILLIPCFYVIHRQDVISRQEVSNSIKQ